MLLHYRTVPWWLVHGTLLVLDQHYFNAGSEALWRQIGTFGSRICTFLVPYRHHFGARLALVCAGLDWIYTAPPQSPPLQTYNARLQPKGFNTFPRFLLHLPRIQPGLNTIHTLFTTADEDKDGILNAAEFTSACKTLGLDHEADPDVDLKAFFGEGEQQIAGLDVREFVVALAILKHLKVGRSDPPIIAPGCAISTATLHILD